MKFSTISTVLASAVALYARYGMAADGAIASDDSEVVKLDSSSFDKFIAENPLVLAEFFAPWCGHCKNLAPEFESAAEILKPKDIRLAQIDCTENAELCQKFEIRGYPTLKVFKGPDSVSDYQGARKSDAIVSYMIKQSLPAVSEVDSEAGFESLVENGDDIVVLAFIDPTDEKSSSEFAAIAEEYRNSYLFAKTTPEVEALAKKYGVESTPTVILLRKSDSETSKYAPGDALTADGLKEFFGVEAMPLFGDVNGMTYASYMESPRPLVYFFYDTEEVRAEYADHIKPLAKRFRGVLNFAGVDGSRFGRHAENLNMKQEWPLLVIHDMKTNKKYGYPQDLELSAEAIVKHVEDFIAGALTPTEKSEPIPETQEENVYKVVAKSFEDIVLDDDKDVLIEIYAPWCGHCKKLAPTYEELGELYKTNPLVADKVIIAKVDGTANDIDVDISGFPTILLYKAHDKENPITYNGARELDDFVTFIAENGYYKVDGFAARSEYEASASETSEEAEESEVSEESSAVEESEVSEESSAVEESEVSEESSAVEESEVSEESSATEESSVSEEEAASEESVASEESESSEADASSVGHDEL